MFVCYDCSFSSSSSSSINNSSSHIICLFIVRTGVVTLILWVHRCVLLVPTQQLPHKSTDASTWLLRMICLTILHVSFSLIYNALLPQCLNCKRYFNSVYMTACICYCFSNKCTCMVKSRMLYSVLSLAIGQ